VRKRVYGRKYKEVQRKLAEAMGDAARGIFFDDENMTVGEYLDRWLRDAVRGSVRESAFDRDSYLIRVHVKPVLGRIKLKNLTPLDVQTLYRDRLDNGLSPSTVNKVHTVTQGPRTGREVVPDTAQSHRRGQGPETRA
jgi:integrase